MPIEILMPALSPTMTEGSIARWLKKEGDKVVSGDVLAEIETDKATMEVESIDDGILGKILISEGTHNVPVNQLIALLLEEDESSEVLNNYQTAKNLDKKQENPAESNKTEKDNIQDNSVSNQTDHRIKASPLAKRLAKLDNVNLAEINGTGPYGRIIKQDVLDHHNIVTAPALKPAQAQIVKGEALRVVEEFSKIPNNNIRRVIAKRLVESKQTIPHFYLSIDCNLDKLLKIREELNLDAENYKLSVNDFVIRACALSLQENPEANSSWSDEAILRYNNVDIAVAVAIDGGLITPIIRNANFKSLIAISNEMKLLAKRARENALKPEEFQGGGFSISNLGMYGIKNFKAIINPPQGAILAIGAGSKRPIVIDEQIKIANIVDVSLSCDHRVVDGAVAAKFLASFKKFIENPIKMLV